MPRYRNVNSGAVVSVREGKDMGSEWKPADEPKPATRRTTKKADTKSADDES